MYSTHIMLKFKLIYSLFATYYEKYILITILIHYSTT